jgi:hypothetical protein
MNRTPSQQTQLDSATRPPRTVRRNIRRPAPCGPRTAVASASRLGGYLAVGVGAGVLGTSAADAGIINIDITSTGFDIDGVNAGLSSGSTAIKTNFPFTGAGSLKVFASDNRGLQGLIVGSFGSLSFAAQPNAAMPWRFPLNTTIGASTSGWGGALSTQLFRYHYVNEYYGVDKFYNSADFGSGSYMGFKTQLGNYGWLNVTWARATGEFQIYSGAYESVPGVSIAAGAVAVPEPSTIAMLGAGALAMGASAIRRHRTARRKAAAGE